MISVWLHLTTSFDGEKSDYVSTNGADNIELLLADGELSYITNAMCFHFGTKTNLHFNALI